jgi:hypothetical protein
MEEYNKEISNLQWINNDRNRETNGEEILFQTC